MPLTTGLSRKVVALLATILLLLCQTAVAAQACAHAVAPAIAADASPPCHEPGAENDSVPHAPHAVPVCESAKAVGESVQVVLLEVTDLPSLPARGAVAGGIVRTALPRTTHALYHPPPLTVLHCRFLN